MKIIFLDIDGVMNNDATHHLPEHHQTWAGWPYKGLDRRLTPRLNKITGSTGAKIVLSSTWRLHFTPEQMKSKLVDAGMSPNIEIIDRTKNLSRGVNYVPRHQEIREWLDAHPEVTDFVILDDDPDAEIEGHFVRTNGSFGLTEEDVNAAIKILDPKA